MTQNEERHNERALRLSASATALGVTLPPGRPCTARPRYGGGPHSL